MTLEERLNDMLEEKDSKIQTLEAEVEKLKWQNDLSQLTWQIHQSFQNDEFSKQMPFPRLEMRLERLSPNNWYSIKWIYGLVYKHYSDTQNDTLLFIPFSQTTSRGGNGAFESHLVEGKMLELPFRDGVHIYVEGILFGLPAYIICRERNMCQKVNYDADFSDQILKMRWTPDNR